MFEYVESFNRSITVIPCGHHVQHYFLWKVFLKKTSK